jgi:phosphoglycolate phosphatase
MENNTKIILASASPRRRELLNQIGIEFEVRVSDVEERVNSTVPCEIVQELSRQKAEAVAAALQEEDERNPQAGQNQHTLVIGADTIVACDGVILGKPADEKDAGRMLRLLSGRSHEVYTGVTFARCGTQARHTFYEVTTVHFAPMTEQEIEEYIATGDPMDKAGAYGIQGFCARYITGIEGDYNNVVGLPMSRLYQELKRFNAEKKAVIFDLDGTLSDSIHSIKYCGDSALAPLGYGPFSEDEYKYFVGDGAANLVRRALAAGGDTECAHFDEAFARYKEIFAEYCMYEVKPYEGIRELLSALKERGIKLAVLSNKPHAETIRVVETLFGEGYFDILQGQKDGVPIKPDPAGAVLIMEQLHLQPEEVLYLGDTATDMKTGKGAGAYTLGALWGFRKREELEEHHADAILAHPLELLNYL